MNRPEIVSIGVVWDSERPSLEHIMAVFATVGTSLTLRDVFQSVVDDQWAASTQHQLVGVVTYYGKHYSTFFFHTKLQVWIYFDDATVREIGPRWEQVVDKCRRGHFQPLLLLYANPDGAPVPPDVPRRSQDVLPSQNHCERSSNIPLEASLNPCSNGVPVQYIDNHNVSNYQRQVDTIKSTSGILPNKPNYIARNKSDSTDPMYSSRIEAGRQRSTSCSDSNNVSRSSISYDPKFDDKDLPRIPDSENVPRRRDSGNWSGDRSSASSSSSTSIENNMPYIISNSVLSKQQLESPQYANLGIGANHVLPVIHANQPLTHNDPGYDSYSLSSNDSFPIQQSLKENLQVINI